ncbi:uncharacterized protein LOC144660863 [Oculina patagonica]
MSQKHFRSHDNYVIAYRNHYKRNRLTNYACVSSGSHFENVWQTFSKDNLRNSKWRRQVEVPAAAVDEIILAVKGPLKVPRKERESGKKHIKEFLWRKTFFKSWIQAKFVAGYETASDSEFAAHLLSLEYRRREIQGDLRSERVLNKPEAHLESTTIAGPQTSTPVKPSNAVQFVTQSATESPIACQVHDSGGLDSSCGSPKPDDCNRENSFNSSMFSEDELSDDTEELTCENNVSYLELYNSAIQDLNDENAIDTSSDEESDICEISNVAFSEDEENLELEENIGDKESVGEDKVEDSIGESDLSVNPAHFHKSNFTAAFSMQRYFDCSCNRTSGLASFIMSAIPMSG